MNKKKSLLLKLIVGFVIVGVVMSILALYFGYSGFKKSMEQQYHDSAYLIADTAEKIILDTVTLEELQEFVDIARGDDQEKKDYVMSLGRYQKIHSDLTDLRKSMQLTDIYVTWYDPQVLRNYKEGDENWKPLLYIFDCYYNEAESFPIGATSSMNAKNKDLFAEVIENKTTQSKFIISNGDFGYNISALRPIMSRDGSEVICVVAVEEPMKLVENSTKMFVVSTMSMILVAMFIIIIFFVFYVYKVVIHPIDSIAAEAARFGEDNEITEASQKLLESINTGDEVEALAKSIGKMEVDMLEYVDNIKAITAEKERIGAELDVATKIQADMLPSIFPAFPDIEGVDIYATMTPAKEVGGDFYDFFLVDENHIGLVMADVSGKGVPAALFMVIAKTLVKNHIQNGESVEVALSEANNQLSENNDEMLFVTTWAAVIDINTGYMEYADAGHEYPFVMKADGTVIELHPKEKRMPLAAFEGVQYIKESYTLELKDKLFLYTDGVPEATDINDKLFGMERLGETLKKLHEKTPKEILEGVKVDVDTFVGEAPQFDDMTMLCFELKDLK